MSGDKLSAAFQCFSNGDIGGAEHWCGEILRESPEDVDALHLLGVTFLSSGRAADGAKLVARAHTQRPQDVVIMENLGLAYLAAQDNAQAEMTLRKALAAGSTNGLTYMRLGMALSLQGRVAESLPIMQMAAESAPNDPDIHLNYGNALSQTGQSDAAAAAYEKVILLRPQHADAYFNLGTLHRLNNRLDQAEEYYQRALEIAPDYAEVHNNLGLVYAAQGLADLAGRSYRRALELAPAMVQALNNRGNNLLSQGHQEEAVSCYEQALAIDPQHPDAYVNLGGTRVAQGNFPDAQILYEQALRLAPADFEAHRGLGVIFQTQARRDEALAHFRQAFAVNPSSADSCKDIGSVFRDAGNLDEAVAWFRKAIELDSDGAGRHYDLAETFKLQGHFDDAAAAYARALDARSDYFAALGGLIYVRQQMCEWTGIEELWERSRRDAIGRADSGITPFSVLSQPTTAEEQLACARAWTEQQSRSQVQEVSTQGSDVAAKAGGGRLRVGYLSWDFHAHATSYLMAEMFELHDRARFEIYAYSLGPEDGSAIRQRIRGAVEHFVDLAGSSDLAAAQRIREDGVDILIDLKGYTQGARTGIMAMRPATVQMNWLGFPGSMGAEFIDYIIADGFVIPPESERFYSEKVLRLPNCYQVNDRHRQITAEGPERAGYGLPSEGFVFCCFNAPHKILPDVFAGWLRLLSAVPGSVLWLIEANRWSVENLRREAEMHGIAAERLVFAQAKPLAEHLRRYRLADLALDTYPYTSHTTGSDALWAGCPLLTRVGETFASRVAGSLLRNVGLPELVTESSESYEQLALELVRDRPRLEELRRRLEVNRDTCALFDTPRFVHDLERGYADIWSVRQAAA